MLFFYIFHIIFYILVKIFFYEFLSQFSSVMILKWVNIFSAREIVMLLRNKQPVPSELFDQVTIMFSDMPAFANITVNCGPLQIIAFLNQTYSLIDEVLPEFDVYKVETINDSYVVRKNPVDTNIHIDPYGYKFKLLFCKNSR